MLVPRLVCGLGAILAVGGALSAQAISVYFRPFRGYNVASRFGIPSGSAGEVLNRIGANEYRGIGQSSASATTGDVVGFRVVLQTSSTVAQTYGLRIRGDSATAPGTPDPSAAGLLLRSPNLSSPVSTGGAQAWAVTLNFQTPARVLPSAQSYHIGVELGATVGANALYLQGDNFGVGIPPRGPVGSPVGVVQGTRVTLVRGSVGIGLVLNRPALMPTAILSSGPAAGYHGLYPDTTNRGDGLAFEFQTLSKAGQLVTLVSGIPAAPALRIGAIDGFVHLDPASALVLDAQVLGSRGTSQIQPAFMGAGRLVGVFGRLQFQSISTRGSAFELSNAVQVWF